MVTITAVTRTCLLALLVVLLAVLTAGCDSTPAPRPTPASPGSGTSQAGAAGTGGATGSGSAATPGGACDSRVQPGSDIAAAARAAPANSVLCLAPGQHRAAVLGRATAQGLTIRAEESARTFIIGRRDSLIVDSARDLTIEGLRVDGGNPAGIYAVAAENLTLRDITVEGATFGIHADNGATVRLERVVITKSTGVGLLVRGDASVTGDKVRVLETAGAGISMIDEARQLTLRDSEVNGTAAVGLFAGIAGCADLPPASLEVPACFTDNLDWFLSGAKVTLEGVALRNTTGPCAVFFPGVEATVSASTFERCELTGLFGWGSTVTVTDSRFTDNAEHALEFRAYPRPDGPVRSPMAATVTGTLVQTTRPLEGPILGATAANGPVLGGGILAQRASLTIRDTTIEGNRDIGVSYVNGSTGVVENTRILKNGTMGLCLTSGAEVTVRNTQIVGNGNDRTDACGARPRG